MKITAKDWKAYVNKLSSINTKAGQLLQNYIDKHGINDTESLITYAHALVTKYGEASSELACQMYDSLARLQGAIVPTAEPAEIANRKEIAGTILKTQNSNNLVSAIQRYVKTASSDTMIKNAKRDNAEWAWVSHGDTCAFCIRLASLGWMPASKAILKGNHAEHIHANCDCEFAIRFDGKSTVEGYNPQRFKKIYDEADGNSPRDKMNAIRRANYDNIKDERNARRRELYSEKVRKNKTWKYKDVTREYFNNATPGLGTIDCEKGINKYNHKREMNMARLLHDIFGGDIKILNEKNTPNIATSDYAWLESYWDLKTVSTEKACDSAIRHGLKQISNNPGGIILDFEDNNIDINVAISIIEKRMTRKGTINIPTDIILIKKSRVLKILSYK